MAQPTWWWLEYCAGGEMFRTVVPLNEVERIKLGIRNGEPVTWSIDPAAGDLQFIDFDKVTSLSFAPEPKKTLEDFERHMAERFGIDWRSRTR